MRKDAYQSVMVLVQVKQRDGHGETETEQRWPGELGCQGRLYLLRYQEESEEGFISNLFKIGEESVTVERTGPIQMKLVYQLGMRTAGIYRTPYGAFRMEALTEAFRFDPPRWGEASLHWAYRLILNGEPAGRFQWRLQIRRAE